MTSKDFPSIPKSIIADKDKQLLKAFMETHYPNSVLDMRKAFENLLDDCRDSIRRQKNIAKRFENNRQENIDNYFEKRKEALMPVIPKENRFLIENDTTKWPWDYDQITYENQGVGIGTCFISLKKHDNRRIAVDRETAPLYFIR